MRTLLLTDIPPCSNYTAGIVTAQICRAIAPDQLSVFCVQNAHLKPEPYADLAHLPMRRVTKPDEVSIRHHENIPIGELGGAVAELRKRTQRLWPLVRQAVEFAEEQRAENLWCVLQGQTMLRMAAPVARAMGVAPRLHIWDPLDWWHRAHNVDRLNAWLDRRLFDRVMRSGASCASASWAMTEHFARRYGIPGEPVIAALDRSLALRPPQTLRNRRELVIGMAGQFYAEREWLTLVEMLHHARWKIAGRKVVLRTMSAEVPPGNIPAPNLDRRGWQLQAEAVRTLAEDCDVLYCGYPFGEAMAEVSRLSFPSKLPTYFAAGRPVLFHGREDSSPGEYLRRRGAAWLVMRPDPASLHSALLNLVEDEAAYARLSAASTAAFEADFTLETQRAAVRRFLGLEPDPYAG